MKDLFFFSNIQKLFSGTLRLWHLPDCVELNVFPTKTLISSAKEIFYQSTSSIEENKPSSIDSSIWKLAVTPFPDVFIALSIYAHRNHSIYLTTLSNLENSINESRKLTFNPKSGAIIDYCFPSNKSPYELYILFDNQTLLRINIRSILSCDTKEFFEENDSTMNGILSNQEFPLHSNELIFKQLFKTRGDPGDSSYYKRKNERIEQQEEKRRKKQHQSTTDKVT